MQTCPAQGTAREIGMPRAHGIPARAGKVAVNETGVIGRRTLKDGLRRGHSGPDAAAEGSAGKIGSGGPGAVVQGRIGKVCSGQTRPVEFQSMHVRAGQARAGEIRAGEIGVAQTGIGKNGVSGMEIGSLTFLKGCAGKVGSPGVGSGKSRAGKVRIRGAKLPEMREIEPGLEDLFVAFAGRSAAQCPR